MLVHASHYYLFPVADEVGGGGQAPGTKLQGGAGRANAVRGGMWTGQCCKGGNVLPLCNGQGVSWAPCTGCTYIITRSSEAVKRAHPPSPGSKMEPFWK